LFILKRKKVGKPDQLVVAKEATRVEMADQTASVVDLTQGRRYEIYPDTAKYVQAEFQTWRFRIENNKEATYDSNDVSALQMSKLWENRNDPRDCQSVGMAYFCTIFNVCCIGTGGGFIRSYSASGTLLKLFPALMIFASMIVADCGSNTD
jgi:lipopolysaccharide export system permease protein